MNEQYFQNIIGGVIPPEYRFPINAINEGECAEDAYLKSIFEAAHQMIETEDLGENKKVNRDFYVFPSNPKLDVTKELIERGCVQVNITVRFPSIEGLKKKKTHYNVHCWHHPSTNKFFLLKLKTEGKYFP